MFIREGLRNVRKHAHASHVVVMGAVRDGILLLTVHDDGNMKAAYRFEHGIIK